METLLPGLIAKYGANQPMSIYLVTKEAPYSFMEVGILGVNLTADLYVYVNNDLAATIEVISGTTSLYAALGPYTNYLFVVKLLTFYITDSRVVTSEIGPIDVESMRKFVNFYAWLALPVINMLLSPGFDLPREYFGIVRIKEAIFNAMDGFCQVGIVPEFI